MDIIDPRLTDVPACLLFDPRPVQATPGWIVFNNQQPLWGCAVWEGDWYKGTYYAAINPLDPASSDMIRFCRNARANLLHYLPPAAAKTILNHHYRQIPGLPPQALGTILIELDAMLDLDAATHARELTYGHPYRHLIARLLAAGVQVDHVPVATAA